MQRYNKYKTNFKGGTYKVDTYKRPTEKVVGGRDQPLYQAGYQPSGGPTGTDTQVDSRPRTPFSVGLIYVSIITATADQNKVRIEIWKKSYLVVE